MIPSVDKDVEKREHLCTFGGDVNWCCHYGRQEGCFSKNLKYNSTSEYVSKGNENKVLKRQLHFHVYCCTIHNSEDVETTWVPFCCCCKFIAVDVKMRCIYTMEYYLSIRNGTPTICDNMNGPWGHYAKWDMSDSERQVLHNITYMWNLKKSLTCRNRVEQSIPGMAGGRGLEGRNREINIVQPVQTWS